MNPITIDRCSEPSKGECQKKDNRATNDHHNSNHCDDRMGHMLSRFNGTGEGAAGGLYFEFSLIYILKVSSNFAFCNSSHNCRSIQHSCHANCLKNFQGAEELSVKDSSRLFILCAWESSKHHQNPPTQIRAGGCGRVIKGTRRSMWKAGWENRIQANLMSLNREWRAVTMIVRFHNWNFLCITWKLQNRKLQLWIDDRISKYCENRCLIPSKISATMFSWLDWN